jgi:hypothetical protein
MFIRLKVMMKKDGLGGETELRLRETGLLTKPGCEMIFFHVAFHSVPLQQRPKPNQQSKQDKTRKKILLET